jgi:integrase
MRDLRSLFSRASARPSAWGQNEFEVVRFDARPPKRTLTPQASASERLAKSALAALARKSSKSVLYGEGKPRRVPLWWDGGTLNDLAAWRAARLATGATGDQPFVASLQAGREALAFSRFTLRKRFRTACRVLGDERLRSLTIHHGRHTFISHALAGGRTLAEVRDAVGHSNVSITSGYLHVAVDEHDVGTLFS